MFIFAEIVASQLTLNSGIDLLKLRILFFFM